MIGLGHGSNSNIWAREQLKFQVLHKSESEWTDPGLGGGIGGGEKMRYPKRTEHKFTGATSSHACHWPPVRNLTIRLLRKSYGLRKLRFFFKKAELE